MTESTTELSSLSLDDVANKVSNIVDVSKQSAIEATDAFVAALVLLRELKRDQAKLQRIRSEKGIDSFCPPADETPAITAVIKNPSLLGCLIRCLLTVSGASCDGQETGSGGGASGHQHHNHHHHSNNVVPPGSRKRSLSVVSEPLNDRASKALKHNHSPVPVARNKIQIIQDSSRKKPTYNPHVLAASILYASFQHIDHWPEHFVRAYAEDSFGPRLWVDDERCSLLVANLALVHADPSDLVTDDARKAAEAAKAASFYRSLDSIFSLSASLNDEQSPPVRRGSLDSSSSRGLTSNSRVKSQQSSVSDDSRRSGLRDGGPGKSEIDDDLIIDDDSDDSSADVGARKDDVLRANRNGNIQGSDHPTSKVRNAASLDSFSNTNELLDIVDPKLVYPNGRRPLDLSQIRQRYFGDNLRYAYESISSSLYGRLEQKSRQNSGLLQSLPSFTTIPAVRLMIAENLEQWLKSPALAGLARSLFSSTVNHMKNVDPPLEEDLKTIDCILEMKLKANQLNAHIENVAEIARRIPVPSIAHHMYSNLLRVVLSLNHADDASNMSELRMVAAIHREVNPVYSYDAIAAVLLTHLVKCEAETDKDKKSSRVERERLVEKLRFLIRAISSELGPSFDGCQLIAALLSLDVNTGTWSTRDEEDKARLMFQCAILVADFVKKETDGTIAATSISSLRQSLSKSRKLLLTWCCSDFGPRFRKKTRNAVLEAGEARDTIGAGIPDFNSPLGPPAEKEQIPPWLRTMRCLLYLEDAESPLMKNFLAPNGIASEGEWNEDASRIKLCSTFGGDVNDELIWVVLKSASLSDGGIDASMAVLLLENLFENCSKHYNGSLKVNDPMIIWELYNLVQFHPSTPISKPERNPEESRDSSIGNVSNAMTMHNLPRLAYPGLWWRVTILALILCGSSTKNIGSVVWNDHPTLQALMKMITSNRYRFPTVDCDEDTRISMKEGENKARQDESKAAEFLFLPRIEEKKSKEIKGARVSRRLLKQQQDKEAAEELAEANNRKRVLRVAQKSIMLWDPDGPARKPPRESVDLLLSAEELFELSDVFQRSTEPDFLLMTIGQTTRGAIERAYDWLIPVISTVPDTITRLPSSASCFLLLRAYGTDGDERKQLKQLAAPLLRHVKDSLNGQYGESNSVKAFDLLMSDVASHKPDRRRCARRVLQDSLEQSEQAQSRRKSWMLDILHVKFAKSLIRDAVSYMSKAARFERGRVLRSFLVALEQHFIFAKENNIEIDVGFPERLMHLISIRPGVCAEAMDAFPDLWRMVTRVVHTEFSRCLAADGSSGEVIQNRDVFMKILQAPLGQERSFKLSLSLLQSICVCLSVWKDNDEELESSLTVQNLTDALLPPRDDEETRLDVGLSGAKILKDGSDAVSVESWILLGKARNDIVARRVALSAPAFFLPRLLLCSGLSKASLLTMIDRLGRLGDSVANREKTYMDLLVPKASSEWDIGRLGKSHDLSRKLLGRVSASMRLHNISLHKMEFSKTFLVWLSSECQNYRKQTLGKRKLKKMKASGVASLSSLSAVTTLLSMIESDKGTPSKKTKLVKKEVEMNDFILLSESGLAAPVPDAEMGDERHVLSSYVKSNDFVELDKWLETKVAHLYQFDVKDIKKMDLTDIAFLFLTRMRESNNHDEGMLRALLKWFPRLSRFNGTPNIWKSMFRSSDDVAASETMNQLTAKCIASWSKEHAAACTDWILNETNTNISEYDFGRITYFLISTSEQPSAQIEGCTGVAGQSPNINEWGKAKEFVASASSIALICLNQSNSDNLEKHVCSRNSLHPGLTLLLLLAKCGKMQLQMVAELILQELSRSEVASNVCNVFGVCLLRMYLNHPFWMDLGSAAVRNALMHASESLANCWEEWRGSMDDMLIDTLSFLFNGELRMSRSLSDLSRRHPLLLLRRLPSIAAGLELNASYNTVHYGDESRGLVSGQNLAGAVDAQVDGRIVKVCVKHWGYTFMEPIWMTLLDIILAMPKEVLFTCGPQVGLLQFLGVYVQLMAVQLQMSASKVSRLKARLTECFNLFQQCNPTAWKDWLGTSIDNSEVRHLLMSCDFISPQAAIESLKRG